MIKALRPGVSGRHTSIKATVFFGLVFCLALTMMFAAAAQAQTNRIAIVFAVGGLGDQSFNDSAYEGMLRAQSELGIEFDYAEPQSVAEYMPLLNRFAQTRQYDLIISIGFNQADALDAVAARFPNQRFAIVDTVVEQPNVTSYVYKEAERGFVLGAIAGLVTSRTDDPKINPQKIVAVVGGMDIPLINEAIAGYIAGAKFVDPDVEVPYVYVGDFADPARGKELTLTLIDRGADIIWGAAGLSGLGVIQAAEEQDKYALGADDDQNRLAPGHVLTSGMKFVNNTVYYAIEQVLAGTLEGGIAVLGLAEGGLGYVPDLVPADVQAEVDALIARIADGSLVPPTEIGAVDAWLEQSR